MADSAIRDFFRRLDANLRSTDGVSSAGITSTTPLSNSWWGTIFDVPGRIPPKKGETLSASDQRITPDYLRTAGVRIVAGRAITSADAFGAGRVVVVNEMLAAAMWPGVNPLGRTLTIDSASWSVVGVAANVHHGGLDEPVHFTLYRSIDQAIQRAGDLAVATKGDPAAMRDVVRHAVSRTDPSAALGEIMTMREMEARHVSPFRMIAGMLAVLATVTMVIATVGLYGLIAYGVAQRTREIGVRIAVGARPRDVLSYVGLGAVRLTVVGLAFGLIGAVAFARLLGAMLYGVTASDPLTFIGAAIGLLIVGLAAALVPAWRASQVDPTVALRK
jgi:predicted permease